MPRVRDAGAAGARRRHGLQHRRRGGRPPGAVARRDRGGGRDPALAGWDGFGVVVQAYGQRAGPVLDWLHALAEQARPPAHGAAGQGRLLGHRDQARAGDGPRRLPGLHPQGGHRRLLHRQRPQAAGHDRPHLSAIRHPQRPHRRRRSWRWPATRAISSSSACTAWARRLHELRDEAAATRAAASTRRSARTGTCWPTWCAACWRTAPTRSFVNQIVDEDVPPEAVAADPFAAHRARPRCRCRTGPDLFQPERAQFARLGPGAPPDAGAPSTRPRAPFARDRVRRPGRCWRSTPTGGAALEAGATRPTRRPGRRACRSATPADVASRAGRGAALGRRRRPSAPRS